MKLTLSKSVGGIFVFCAFAFSCASTPKTNEINNEDTNDSSNNNIEEIVSTQIEEQEEVLPPPPTESEIYAQKISGVKLTLISSPKETTKGKIFTSPYILKTENSEEKPVESFEISVVYPFTREDGKIVFSETMITTDSEGKAEFLPPKPEFSFNSEIYFFPKADLQDSTSEDEKSKISELANSVMIKAQFNVQTNLQSAGGIIALVDFNQNGKAITGNPISSSNLLMTLMKLGFVKIGNAPPEILNAVIQNDETKIHDRVKLIDTSFVIFGTIKIDSAEKTESGSTYILTSNIKSMDSKTGKITFACQKTISVSDKNDWNALANARKMLADILANEIKYGI